MLDPQESPSGKGEGQFKEHLMLSDKSNLNREWSILAGIISIIIIQESNTESHYQVRWLKARKSIKQSDEGDVRHE